MRDNESTMGVQSEEKPKKMTKAEFMVVLDEVNAILQKNIAQAREIQAGTEVSNAKVEQLKAETQALLLKL